MNGNMNFIISKTSQIIEDMNSIKNHYNNLFTDSELSDIETNLICVEDSLNKMKYCATKNLEERDKHRIIIEEYSKVKNIEKACQKFSIKIWQKELTDIKDFESGKPFKFLVHNITGKGKVTPMNIGEKQIISTSLITDKHMGVYGSNKYGFVYPLTDENLIMTGKDDIQSYDFRYDGKYDKDIHEKINEEYYLDYINSKTSKLMTPYQVENDNILRNIKENGGILKDGESPVYNEIILSNDDTNNRPIAVYCINDDEKDRNYGYAIQLSKEFDIPLIEIDKVLYRDKQNKTLDNKESRTESNKEKISGVCHSNIEGLELLSKIESEIKKYYDKLKMQSKNNEFNHYTR